MLCDIVALVATKSGHEAHWAAYDAKFFGVDMPDEDR
jgi:hypothetical protein